MKKILITLTLFISIIVVNAQDFPPNGLTGKALRVWLKKNWYDGKFSALGYDDARHAMYDDIDLKGGNLIGVYGGYTHPFIIGGSFTDSYPITAEHTVPQSYFNYLEPMKSDIHHLFPAHNDLNVARSNYPFMEIDDNSTDKWWVNTNYITTIPTSNINDYSEEDWQKFEPREDHKGNVARAVYYFYTMYPTQGGVISDCANINDLYNWHTNELVDTDEQDRNDAIEIHQGNRNPYIDYPELLGHAWGNTSPNANPILNFVERKVAVHPDNADGTVITIELEISPKPTSLENVTISADAASTLSTSNYSFSKTSFAIDSNSSLQSFTVSLTGNAQGYVQINLNGLSSNVDYGYNDTYFLYVSENLSTKGLIEDNPIISYSNNLMLLNNSSQYINYDIISIDGSISAKGKIQDKTIELNHLTKGVYIVRLSNKYNQYSKKVIVE